MQWLVQWFVTQIAWLIVESNWNEAWASILSDKESDEDNMGKYCCSMKLKFES